MEEIQNILNILDPKKNDYEKQYNNLCVKVDTIDKSSCEKLMKLLDTFQYDERLQKTIYKLCEKVYMRIKEE